MAGNPDIISFLLTLLLGGTIMLGLFIVFLLIRSELGFSKWLLTATLLALMMHLFTFLIFITQLIQQYPHLLGTTFPLVFVTGPSFYFFIRSYAEPGFKFRLRHLVHLIPVTLIIVMMIPTYAAPAGEKLETIRYYYEFAPSGSLSWFEWLYLNLYVALILGYVIASLVYIGKAKPYNAALLKRFSGLFLTLSIIYLVLQSGFFINGTSLITSEIILSILMAVVILMLGYWILDIRQLFPPKNQGKYRTSPLSGQQATHIRQSLLNAMEQEELFLNPHLKVSDTARFIKVPPHHLSQVLNDHMNTNFYQLVNSYRIEKSKQLLKTDRLRQISIQGIGYDCGFSNKTSFFRAFKKMTGMTPAEYAAASISE